MEDDVIDNENDSLDFDDALGEKDSTLMPDLSAKGSLSDIEIDYETRSEISEDEDNAEDTGKTASNLSEDARDKHCTEKSGSAKEVKAATKTDVKTRVTLNNRFKEAEQTLKSKKNADVEDSMLKTLFQDARFFLMKTSDANNIKVSQLRQVWFTDPQNVTILNSAAEAAKNVILIFSAKWTGRFSGFALLKGSSTSDDPPRDWAPSIKTLGGSFHVKWLSRKELLFSSSNHLTHPSSGGKLVSICVDGQEIEGKVGQELCQLLIEKGVEPEESADQRRSESPVESQQGDGHEREKSSKSSASRIPDHTRDRTKHESSRRKRSNGRERSPLLKRGISRGRTRIRSLGRSGSNLHAHSPVGGSGRIERRSPGFDSNYTISERRGRSPVRRDHRVRGGHSSDRKIRSSTERSPRLGSIASNDLRHRTSRGQYCSRDSYDKTNLRGISPDVGLSPLNEMYDHQSYDSYDDDPDESAEPAGMSGRFVIVRSPISQTVASPSPVVQTELSLDNYELMSENGSDHQVETLTKAEVAPGKYCTLAPSLPVEKSLTSERLSVLPRAPDAPRNVYENLESLGRSQSRGTSQVSHRDNPSHQSIERRSLSRQATYNDENYPSYKSIRRRSLSHELLKTTCDIYMPCRSIGRSQSRMRSPSQSRSRAIHTNYSSHEVARRRSQSRGRSQSRDRLQATHREYDSARMRSRSYGRIHDTNRDYTHESPERSSSYMNRSETSNKRYALHEPYEQKVERHMDSRMRRSPHEISPDQSPSQKLYDLKRGGYNSRGAEDIPQSYGSRESEIYDRHPVRFMNSESRSRYSVPEESMDASSLHHRSPELKRRRQDYSEYLDDRSRRFKDEPSPPGLRRRLVPEPRLYPERVPEGVYDRRQQERHVPIDSGTLRSDAAHGRYHDQRSTNHNYAQANQNTVPTVVPYGLHVPPPVASSYLPAAHQNYYRSLPPPLLPPVSSKLLEPMTLQSPINYNPKVPPPMIPPAPSKYVDDVPPALPVPPKYFQGGIPPKPHGQSTGGVWVKGQRSVPAHYNQTPSQKYISAEEFIELCNIKKPMRGSTFAGARRRY